MLESLEQMNLKRMSVEKPERQEIPFDAEKVLSEKDWIDIESLLRKSEEDLKSPDLKTTDFSHMVFAMRILRPNQDLRLSETTGRIIGRYSPEIGLDTLARLKSLLKSLKLTPFGNWDWFNKQLREYYAKEGIVEEMKMASTMKQCSRNQPENWQVPINKVNEQLDLFRRQSNWEQFTQLATNTRIVTEKPVELEPSDWEGMEQAVIKLRESMEQRKDPGTLVDIFFQVAEMKILAAKEMKYTDEGLELVMSDPSLDQSKEPLPQERSF